MAALEYLSPDAHAGIRVRPAAGVGRHFAQVVPAEFARVATRCPILFTKHAETGSFYAGALLGFAAGENLLVDNEGKFAGIPPLDLEREGFFIVGDDLAIDRQHPRFQAENGAPLFDEEGAPSAELRRVQQALVTLKRGVEESDVFTQALLDHGLIEPIDIALSFDDGGRIQLDGLYSIGRDGLADLDDAAALSLLRAGHLQAAYVMIESLNQIPLLARRRNDRLSAI
jgi:hypothetical protein